MKKGNVFVLGMLMFFSLGFVACDDDDDKESPAAIDKEVEIDATAYDQWTYFSFETGEVVGTSAVDENRDGLDWDIAFHRYDVRTNSGTSGSGQGGVYIAEDQEALTGWNAIVEAPEDGYVVDTEAELIKEFIPGGSSVMVTVPASEVITGGYKNPQTGIGGTWLGFSYNSQSAGPVYEITNQIFVVKSAEGKYAKVWLKAYQKLVDGQKKGGYITMKYAYQEDGSTSLN